MESHSGEVVGRNVLRGIVVVSVMLEMVEASVTGVIWVLTVSTVVVALATVVMLLIFSAVVVVVGAAVVVVESGNIPVPDPSPREFLFLALPLLN